MKHRDAPDFPQTVEKTGLMRERRGADTRTKVVHLSSNSFSLHFSSQPLVTRDRFDALIPPWAAEKFSSRADSQPQGQRANGDRSDDKIFCE